MNIRVGFSQQDWERLARDWSAWWAGELDRPMVVLRAIEFESPMTVQEIGRWDDPEDPSRSNLPLDEILDHHQRRLESAVYLGDSWPRWWPNFGPGIMAAFAGASVESMPGTTWFKPLPENKLADFQVVYDPHNPWWDHVKALTQAAVSRWRYQVTVAFTDLGGNLDILASLRGTDRLLLDLHDAPEEVDRLVGETTRSWLRYYDELYQIISRADRGTSAWTPLFSLEPYYMLQSDFAYMISPAMFERFVMPDLEACCSHIEHAFYHLDGKGQIRHLDLLLSIKRLRGIQWIPGDGQPPAEKWLPLLKRIRDGGKLCQVYATPEGALQITRELGGKGLTFWILDELPPDEAADFLRLLTIENEIHN